jgi:hypothetical protein
VDLELRVSHAAGLWLVLSFGVVQASGTLPAGPTHLELQHDPAPLKFTARINGSVVYSTTSPGAAAYKPVVFGLNSGDQVTDVQICT